MFCQHTTGKHIIMSSSHLSTHHHHHHLLSFSSSCSTRKLFFPTSSPSIYLHNYFLKSSVGAVSSEAKDKQDLRCRAISKSRTKEYPELVQDGLATIKWRDVDVEGDTYDEPVNEKVSVRNKINKLVEAIKSVLSSMEDGEITISAYDTAWVALVEDENGAPQFPTSLEWIANNQLPDGSWGDSELYSAHDRVINTLACIIALKTWNLHPQMCEKGMEFFKENLHKLKDENEEHMPIGFEVAFPSLLDIARTLNIEVPEDSPILNDINAKRNVKLTRIPKEMMHKVPTTLLHSLEGMSGLDWDKLLKLQSQDGSFLFSPSSTAFALKQTRDENCLKYLTNAVKKFNGGVPNVYPVDLFEHIWAVDRIERLGISRYFQQEIKECMSYIFRNWDEKGICWARNSEVQDIDDTAMGFRLLRTHGYQVSADVFKNFQRNGEFFCFVGQSNQAVTGMFNLYRASQLQFPGEDILENAKHFSGKFLREKQATNELIDKWIIMKDLPGEVAFALDVPWYASLPRVETRTYVDQYGGEDDAWIGKTLYRMPIVNNNSYLELAKLDYNNCQVSLLKDWGIIQKWCSESRLGVFGLSRRSLLLAYFLAAASIFEPERSHERLAWAKSTALIETIASYAGDAEMRKTFVQQFNDSLNSRDFSIGWSLNRNRAGHGLSEALVGTIDQISWDVLVSHGHEIGSDMLQSWKKWLSRWQSEGDKCQGQAELLVQIINLSAGHWISEELLLNPEYQRLVQLTNSVCHRLRTYQEDKEAERGSSEVHGYDITFPKVESEMQELAQLVCQKSPTGVDSNIKNTFLTVVKTFYYAAFFDSKTINFHIAKILFDNVV